MNLTPEFLSALEAVVADHDRYGHISSGDWEENGAMRVVGIALADAVALTQIELGAFDADLRGEPEHRASAVMAIVEICLAVGVRLERARWEES